MLLPARTCAAATALLRCPAHYANATLWLLLAQGCATHIFLSAHDCAANVCQSSLDACALPSQDACCWLVTHKRGWPLLALLRGHEFNQLIELGARRSRYWRRAQAYWLRPGLLGACLGLRPTARTNCCANVTGLQAIPLSTRVPSHRCQTWGPGQCRQHVGRNM